MADTASVAPGTLRDDMRGWRWLALYVAVSLCLAIPIASHLPQTSTVAVFPPAGSSSQSPQALLPGTQWRTSAGMRVLEQPSVLSFTAGESLPRFASLPLTVAPGAEFLDLRLCLAAAPPIDGAHVMLASVRDGELDFNRQFAIYSFHGGEAGTCFAEPIPRRAGDGPAILQVQLEQPQQSLELQSLSLTPLVENPLWTHIRRGMLLVGLLLIVYRFSAYWRPDTRLMTPRGCLTVAGLGVVAGILFGCCANVSLKADIFALLTGGRTSAAGADLEALLLQPFPTGGFSLFTNMHALLYGAATLCLGLLRRGAWFDLFLLAPVTEILQLFVPGRGPGLADAIVDWTGVGVAMLLVVALRRSQRVCALLQG